MYRSIHKINQFKIQKYTNVAFIPYDNINEDVS